MAGTKHMTMLDFQLHARGLVPGCMPVMIGAAHLMAAQEAGLEVENVEMTLFCTMYSTCTVAYSNVRCLS